MLIRVKTDNVRIFLIGVFRVTRKKQNTKGFESHRTMSMRKARSQLLEREREMIQTAAAISIIWMVLSFVVLRG